MNCPSCGHENPDRAKFCLECGGAFSLRCPSCETELPAAAKFCLECGTRAAAPAEAAERAPTDYTPRHLADRILRSRSALEGERKQVTVLFADVKGSMEITGEIDPEQWHGILDGFLQLLADGVHRFEGTVNQYTGDGIMALFGAPIAHEDHAQRACFAALHLLAELREFARDVKRRHGFDFAVRIGLNSGEVVVGKIGDDLRMDYTAAGQTVGLAQRMESLAEPNTCALSKETAALTGGYFELEDLGVFSVKGVPEPVPVFALRGVGAARTRLDRSRSRGFSKFVGRARELDNLEGALEEAIAGNGQVVGVVADAGTGKSRLCLEFVEGCRARGIRVNEAHCPAHGKTIPYLPLLEMLRSIFDIRDDDGEREARRKIAGEILLLDDRLQEMLPLIFDFLGVPDPDRPAPTMTPEGRQQQLIGFVRDLMAARSRHEPAVLLLDDLHWIDPGSDDFLAHGVDSAEGTRTLWLVNFRPEYRADWMQKSTYRQLPLRPLGREEIEELLEDLLGADPSVAELPERIHQRTGGNPFFIEEVVQSLVENGNLEGERGAYRLVTPPDALEIPGTVRSVLSARIDRLAEREKRLLQTASVIDKEFSQPVLKRVVDLSGEDLAGALALLVQSEFLIETALYPVAEYAFKHPLTQEVAYQSQLAERRASLHARVAQAIEEIDADALDERAGLLAYHWESAGEPLVSARWHARAAKAIGFDSPAEALRHNEKVWELVPRPADSEEAAALACEAACELLKLGFRQGMSGERAEEIFSEGLELGKQRGDPRSLVALYYGYGVVHMLAGAPPERAMALYQAAIAEADTAGDPELRWAAREPGWFPYAMLGEFEVGLRVSQEALEISRDQPLTKGTVVEFSAAWLWGGRGWLLTDVGRMQEAADAFQHCERGAEQLEEVEQLAWNDGFRARMHTRQGNAEAAILAAGRAVERAEKIGSTLVRVLSLGELGTALALRGDFPGARDRLEHALALSREHRVWLAMESDSLAVLAEVQLALGESDLARSTAAEAIRIGEERETVICELRAQLAHARVLLALDGAEAREPIERALDRALDIARSTGARSYEPFVHEERGQLAETLGDRATREREIARARQLFADLGASGHAARLSQGLSKG